MTVSGRVNRAREPIVEVSLVGLDSPLQAVVDTGFTGALLISHEVADQAKLRLRATEYFTLADGSVAAAFIAQGQVNWLQEIRIIDILVAEASDALLGAELLEGCRLVVDFADDTVSITQVTKSREER